VKGAMKMIIPNQIKFRRQIILFAALLVAACISLNSCSEKKTKVYRVGILSGLDFFANTTDGFKEKMTELGYVEGKDIIYDVQKTDVDINAYKSILKKFVADKVDLIFVFPTEASMEAKSVTAGTGIPIVFTNAFTENTGLVNNVREPGGNITGVRWPGPDLVLQNFEVLRELVPNAKRIVVPYFRGYPITKSQLEVLRPAFADANITMIEIPANTATELEASLKVQNQIDAILMVIDPLCTIPDNFIVIGKYATEHNIPFGGGGSRAVGEYESVFGIAPQNVPQGRQAAFLADKILRGTPAGNIPVISAEGYLQISYKAAQKLGLNVPEGLLSRANEIIR
jgi:putative ABC transport system substrate-binding protein